jgi:hypothetical protein
MTTSSYSIFDSSTGEIKRVIIGSATLATDNVGSGETAKDVDGVWPSSLGQYHASPGGAATLTDRPTFACSIPGTVLASDPLSITLVPASAVVTIVSTGGGGGTHTQGGSLATLDASISGAADGDVLTVTITLWPYITLTGESIVSAP